MRVSNRGGPYIDVGIETCGTTAVALLSIVAFAWTHTAKATRVSVTIWGRSPVRVCRLDVVAGTSGTPKLHLRENYGQKNE